MTITFQKSDAMHDRFPSEPDELTLEVPGPVQMTYGDMRSVDDDGDTFAYLDGSGDWADSATGQHWSDVVIAS